jgi:uncharacterized repeat protein (TIGR02543 family)
MNCTENCVMARRPLAALAHAKGSRQARAGQFTKFLSVLILAVILGSMPVPPNAFGQIVYEESRTGGSSGLTTVTTSTNLTGANGHLYLAAISSRPRKLVKSVTGLGLNWVLVKSICSADNSETNMDVWMAQGTPSGNGAVTATFWTAPSTAVIAVSRYSGVAATNPIGNVIAGNTNGLNGACTGGVGSTSYSFNLTTTVNDAVVYGAVAPKARAHGPGAGYTERVDFKYQHPVTTTGVVVVEKTVASAATVTVDGVFHASEGPLDWALVALEIKPAVTPWSGPIVYEENETGGSSGAVTVTTSASLIGVSGNLYLAAISARPRKLVQSVTGLGLNWTLVKSICSGNNSTTMMDVWMAQGTPSGNGAVTATFWSAPSTAVIAVSRYSGVAAMDPIGNIIAGNVNGLDGACAGGVDDASYSFNLTTTVNDAVIYGAVALKARTHTPGAGYAELVEFQHPHAINPLGLAVEGKSVASASTTTIGSSFDGPVDWALVALVIKPQGAQHTLTVNTVGSGSVALNPSGGTYDVGTEVTLTATAEAGFVFSGWSGDLTGSANPATITVDGNKNVTATFAAISWNGPIVYEESQTGGSSGSVTVTTAANLTGVSGHLYLAAISSRPRKLVQSVTGLGLNWTLVKSICSGNNSTTMMDVWMAQGTPSGDGTVTATFWTAPSTAIIAVSRYSGVASPNPIGNIVAGNVNGSDGACTGGVDGNAYSFNLTTTVNDGVIYSAVALKARAHTPGAGYTELVEFQHPHAVNPLGVAVEGKGVASASTVPVDGSFDGPVDWALVAFVIKPPQGAQHTVTVNTAPQGGGSVAFNPPGGTYDAGTEVTLTATPAGGYQFSGWSGDLSGSTNPATITMDGDKNVTATFTAIPIVLEEIKTGGSTGSTTVTTSASLTGVSGHLYLAAISTVPLSQVLAVSGLGLNWTLVRRQCAGQTSTNVEVWKAQGTPSGNGTVTATVEYGNSTIAPVRAAVIAVSRYSGVAEMNPIGNVISSNVGGITTSTTFSGCNGLPSNAYSFNLTTTVNGAVVFGAAAMKSRTHTPGAGYTEQAEKTQASSTYTSSIAVQDKAVAAAGTVTVNGSFNGTVDWAVVALEIKPQAAISKLSVTAENKSADDLSPAGYQLEQNYPNPFSGSGISGRSSTLIAFSLPAASQVTVNIYNETGQLVRTLVDGEMPAGRHRIYWNGTNQTGGSLASGLYLYQIIAQGRNGEAAFTQTKRLMLLK